MDHLGCHRLPVCLCLGYMQTKNLPGSMKINTAATVIDMLAGAAIAMGTVKLVTMKSLHRSR